MAMNGMPMVNVTAPPGSVPGQRATIRLDDGTQFIATIPEGVKAGQQFPVYVAQGTPATSTRAPAAVKVDIPRRYIYQGEGPREAQAVSCGLILFAVLTLILSLFLLTSITHYFSYLVYYCQRCNLAYCYTDQCIATSSWISTSPISVDALPFRNATGDSHEPNGDGHADNWSLIVAVFCNVMGCMIFICSSTTVSMRRGGPASVLASGTTVAMLLHIATIVCMSIQLISNMDGYVYNAFCGTQEGSRCTENYVEISGQSLASYWYNDYYYNSFGTLVYWVFYTTCILVFFELFYVILSLCADEKYSGSRRSSEGPNGYWY
mmetsp:Transcript_7191/g.18770  ORF Transcript_7191/g.18770 Transcript_7191/m.18770 type:complete len:321 (-) Transcript_7191:464-1426(-)|eukprot:CAMPEP_0115846694 /NCGR_PEP_ID=MMETSP0287-20121206/9992_1 /TAXON_ID=412157 /ORGANISM="Chrysochromulina rotalis, Strain UIO044" /LENGTH=320 /DNA_ID=CAMNT_0003300491 /DNA_START=80 /DNA_END=1042 /DNA_ORIENTATION=+